MVDLMIQSGKINDREAYRQEVYRREEESTTGIGEGIAIPTARAPLWTAPAWPPWWSKTAWILILWTESRST